MTSPECRCRDHPLQPLPAGTRAPQAAPPSCVLETEHGKDYVVKYPGLNRRLMYRDGTISGDFDRDAVFWFLNLTRATLRDVLQVTQFATVGLAIAASALTARVARSSALAHAMQFLPPR